MMMRKNNNSGKGNYNKNRSGGGGGGGQRRYNNSGGGGHSGGGSRGPNDGQNIARTKHHAMQMREKYANMARDAQINGDRVDVEYYLQHVDHYTRVLTDIAAIENERFAHQREQQQNQPQDANSNNDNQNNQPQGENSGGDNAPQDAQGGSEGGDQGGQRQPRQQHRRQHNNPPADHNGAQEANSNTTEIPLPGSILPVI
jgi:hypothetical protein